MHHIKTWWEYCSLPNILFVHYADLLADPGGEIQRIADFLGVPLPTTALPTVCEAVTLDAMRRIFKATYRGLTRSGTVAPTLSSSRAPMAAGAV